MSAPLDDLLTTAAPPVHRSPEVRAALEEMVEATARETAPARVVPFRRRRVAVLALAATTVLGAATTTAAASGWLPGGWWEDEQAVVQRVTTDSGQDCTVTYAARPFTDAAHPVGEAERAAALRAAEEFLAGLDTTTLPATSTDEAFRTVDRRLQDELRRQGLSAYAVGVAMASDCPDAETR